MYDVIIVGAGPAGISASLYTVRRKLKTLIIYKEKSSLEKSTRIENYYGFESGINGEDLYKIGIRQAQNIGAKVIKDEVTNIKIEYQNKAVANRFKEEQNFTKVEKQKIFKVQTLNNEFESKSVILATGNKKSKPNIKNIDKYEGKGISYCAICDGFFYRNKDVAVLGDGNYAISETMDLQNIAKSITILTNGGQAPEYRAENIGINTKPIKEIRRRK